MACAAAKLWENAFETIPDVSFRDAEKKMTKIWIANITSRNFSRGFGGARGKRTSKSASASNFAQDTPILRSVRPKIAKKRLVPGGPGLCQPYRHVRRLVQAWWLLGAGFQGVCGVCVA